MKNLLAELAILLVRVYLILSEKRVIYLNEWNWHNKVSFVGGIKLQADIHFMIFLFNLWENYWYVVKAICHKSESFLIIYNSWSELDANLIKT